MVVTEAPKLATPSSFRCFSSFENRLSNLGARPGVKTISSTTQVPSEAACFSVWGNKGTSVLAKPLQKTLRAWCPPFLSPWDLLPGVPGPVGVFHSTSPRELTKQTQRPAG